MIIIDFETYSPELIEELDEEDDLLQELCWEAQNAGITNS